MLKSSTPLFLVVAIGLSSVAVRAQDAGAKAASSAAAKTIVVANQAKSDTEIAVPPVVSVRVTLNAAKGAGPPESVDLSAAYGKWVALNGLQSPDVRPYHVVVEYDCFDEDGDNFDSGVFEEYWAGPRKYKRSYKSESFNQTDFASAKGLFRAGDQKFPSRVQMKVRSEVIAPFTDSGPADRIRGRIEELDLAGYTFQCMRIERGAGNNDPNEYCFEPQDSVLRYTRGEGWFQTAYNHMIEFQGSHVAQDVTVTDGGKPYLNLHVKTLEPLPQPNDAIFTAPAGVAGPLGSEPVSGVSLVVVDMPPLLPWPSQLRSQRFVVTADIVVGKNGHVISAHATSGPPAAYKTCEESVRRWVFKPYMVLDTPVEVIQKVQCQNN
jgi:hypothetical protein